MLTDAEKQQLESLRAVIAADLQTAIDCAKAGSDPIDVIKQAAIRSVESLLVRDPCIYDISVDPLTGSVKIRLPRP